MITTPLSFVEEVALLQEIEADAIQRVGKRLPPDRVTYFKSGLQMGMAELLVQLSAKGKIDRRTT